MKVQTDGEALAQTASFTDKSLGPPIAEALGLHDIITGDNVRTGSQWRFDPYSFGVAVLPCPSVTAIDVQPAAAAAGLEVANVLSYRADEGLAPGTLRRVLQVHALPPVPIHRLFDAARANLRSLSQFLDDLRAHAKSRA